MVTTDLDAWLAQDLHAAEALDTAVPVSRRPSWAAGVLLAAVYAADREDCASHLVSLVTDVAEDERRWGEAHGVFQQVRQETLRLQEEDDWTCQMVVLIAESAAKVTYNASGRSAPFDANSGTVLVLRAAELATRLDAAKATDLLWRAVTQSPSSAG